MTDSHKRLFRVIDCAATLCSLGVERREASGVLQWIDAPDAFKAVAPTRCLGSLASPT